MRYDVLLFISCSLMLSCAFCHLNQVNRVFFLGYETATTSLVMLCKMFVTMCFNVGYIYVGELFPTEVRHMGFGISNTAGRISGLFSAYLGEYLVSQLV